MSAAIDVFTATLAAGFRRAALRQAEKAAAETTTIKNAVARTGDGAIALQLSQLFGSLADDVEAAAAQAKGKRP